MLEFSKKIEDMIRHIYRVYGCKNNEEQIKKLKYYCVSEIVAHEGLKEELEDYDALKYFVIQMALENVDI